MEQAEQTMLDNLKKNTGKDLNQWIALVKKENFQKHGEILKFLKEKHSFTHGFANMVALKARAADSGSVENKDSLIEKQYKGKEHFLPFYEKLLTTVNSFGNDVEVAPKNTYVSLRRKKQFATIGPGSKTRYDIGINLKGQAAEGLLEEVKTANAMCSHKIAVTDTEKSLGEVSHWLRKAYDLAG